jgi:predicted transposase YbfD/YdcC
MKKMKTNEKENDLSTMITDHRQDGKIKHPLQNIMMITICAVICGANSWKDIADFGRRKKEWLQNFLTLPDDTTPSADTIARLFHAIKVKEFEQYFLSWTNSIIQKNNQNQDYIAVDGKTLRRSYDKKSDKAAIHMVSAWSSMNSCVLGQVKTEEKSNEITAIPELLKVLEIKGTIITIDAMGTQKKIASTIVENGGDYILAVKGNQPTLESEIINYFENNLSPSNINFCMESDSGHGRSEIRQYWISGEIDFISTKKDWKNLNSIGMTESSRTVNGKTTVQKKYYITSIPPDVKAFSEGTRKHWGIENSLHWCLDVAFREDECRIRKGFAAENLAIVRHIALNMLRNEKSCKRGIAGKRFNAALDNNYLKKVLNV